MRAMLAKISLLLVMVISLGLCGYGQAPSISIVRFNDTSTYVPGGGISIHIKPTGVFPFKTKFTLQLTNIAGTVLNNIGSVDEFFTPMVNGILPSGLAPGTYRLKVQADSLGTTITTSNLSTSFDVLSFSPAFTPPNLVDENLSPKIACWSNNFFGFVDNNATATTSNSTLAFDQADITSNYTALLVKSNGTIVNLPVFQMFGGTLAFQIPSSLNCDYYNLELIRNKSGKSSIKTFIFQFNTGNTSLGNTSSETVCVGNVVNFTTSKGVISANYPGSYYIVNYGDGSALDSFTHARFMTDSSFLHKYTIPTCNAGSVLNKNGMFQVDLILMNKGVGGTSSASCNMYQKNGSGKSTYVNTSVAPLAAFSGPDSVCINSPATFVNSTTSGQYGTSNVCSTSVVISWEIKRPSQNFFSAVSASSSWIVNPSKDLAIPSNQLNETGIWHIRMTAKNPEGCNTVSEVIRELCVQPVPIPNFKMNNLETVSGCAPVVVQLDNNTNSMPCRGITYQWTIFDSTQSTIAPSNNYQYLTGTSVSYQPKLQFDSSGKYYVQLSAKNACGTFTSAKKLVHVLGKADVRLPSDKSYCGLKTINFATDNNHKPNYNTNGVSETFLWQVTPAVGWNFVNATTATSRFPQIEFTDYGTYTVKVTFNNSCGIAQLDQQVITFYQPVNINITTPNNTYACYNADTIQLKSDTTGKIQSLTWTSSSGGSFSNGSSLNPIYNISSTDKTNGAVTLTVQVVPQTPSLCSTVQKQVIIQIRPRNYINNANNNITICSGQAVNFSPNAILPGSTYSWTHDTPAGVTFNNGSSTTTIDDKLTSSSTTNTATVTYTIIPKKDGCDGDTFTLTVKVKPLPSLTAIPTADTICSGTQANINLSSTLPGGAHYSWTVSTTGSVSGQQGSTGVINTSSIQQTLTNTGTTAATVTYTIKAFNPGSPQCEGQSKTVSITVNPAATVNFSPATSQTICSGEKTTKVVLSSTTSGATITWQSVPGAVSGVTANGTDSIGVQTLTNNTNAPIDVIYKAKATTGGSCDGTEFHYKITVNPLPNGSLSSTTPICTDSTGKVTFTSTSGLAPYTVKLQVKDPANATSTKTFNSVTSGQTLTVLAAGSNAGSYLISIESISDDRGCTRTAGFSAAVNLTVNPKPTITLTADTAICPGSVATLNASGASSYSWSPASGLSATTGSTVTATVTSSTTYTVTGTTNGCSNNKSVTVSLKQKPAKPGVTTPIIYCRNETATPLTATASGTLTWFNNAALTNPQSSPYTPNTSSAGTTKYYVLQTNTDQCKSDTAEISVIVHPSISGNSIGNPQTICSGGTVATLNTSGTIAGGNGSFNYVWQQSTNGGTNWNIATGSANSPTYTPTTLTATTIYRRIVTSSSCSDTSNSVTITVQGSLSNYNISSHQTICIGSAPATLIGELPAGGDGTFSYVWEQSDNGSSWVTIPGANGKDYSPPSLTANTFFRRKVTSGQCSSYSSHVLIKVNPIPVVNNINDIVVCNNAATGAINFSSSTTSNTSYEWSNDNIGIGLAASGTTASISSFNGSNSSKIPAVANVTVKAIYNADGKACTSATKGFKIVVLPMISINNIPNDTACTGAPVAAITPVSDAGSYTGSSVAYAWTVSSAIGLAGGSGTVISAFTAMNSTNAAITAMVSVTPQYSYHAKTCPGTAESYHVVVKPKPVIADATTEICSGGNFSLSPLNNNPAGNIVPVGTLYSWSTPTQPVEITGAGSGTKQAIIKDTLYNSSTSTKQVIYSITPDADGCPGAAFDYTVTVNPVPDVANKTITVCSDATFTISPTGVPTGTTYSWSMPTGSGFSNASAGSNQIDFSQKLLNNTANAVTATYQVTPKSGSCAGNDFSVVVTVNPSATVQFSQASQTICSGDTSTTVKITSASNNVNISWAATSNGAGGVTPLSGDSTIPSMTLTNTTTAPISVIFKAKATTIGTAACPGKGDSITVVVNPRPTLSANPTTQTICSDTTTHITLTPNISTATFGWIVVAPASISGATSGTAASIIQKLSNNSNTAATVQYTAAATFTNNGVGCTGDSVKINVVVNPTPGLTLPADTVICSGQAFKTIELKSDVSGATFNWQATAPSTISGHDMSGTNVTTIPGKTLINNGNKPDTVVYTITPLTGSGTGGCAGGTKMYKVIVNPSPKVSFSLSNQTICSGQQTAKVTLNSATQGVSYSWTSIANGAGGVKPSGDTNFIDIQTLTNTTINPINVIYIVKAHTSGFATCSGDTSHYTITVNPIPKATATPGSEIICSGAKTNIQLSSAVPGTAFGWQVQPNGNISGTANGNGASIEQTIINLTASPQQVLYIVTPTFSLNNVSCSGDTIHVRITVNPSPKVSNTDTSQTLCSEATTSLVTFSSLTSQTTYSWTATSPAGVTGFTSTGDGALLPTPVFNSNNTVADIVFNVTPKANNCSGQPFVYHVYVKPKPNVILPNFSQTICSGAASSTVSLTSSVVGTLFNWSAVPSTTAVTGFTPSQNGVSNIASQVLSNSSNQPQYVTYTILPVANGCTGPDTTYVINISPTPGVILPAAQTICSGSSSSAVTLSSEVAGAVFTWTASSSTSAVSGFTATSGGQVTSIPAQTITNTSTQQGSVTYQITPITTGGTSSGCPGTAVPYTIYVNPVPVVNFSISDQNICSGSTTAPVFLTSATPNVSFYWQSAANGVLGVLPQGGDTIQAQPLTYTGTTPATVVYTAKATTTDSAACIGTSKEYKVIVNPVPDVTVTAADSSICTNTTTDITIFSSVTGTTFTWTVVANGGITGASAGGGSSISQTLVNPGVSPATVTYSVTPKFANSGTECTGATRSITITVNPAAAINNNPLSQQVCTGTQSTPVTFTSSTSGSSYSWSVSGSAYITGYTSSGTGNLPAMPLNNSSASKDSLKVSVVSTANECPGPPTDYTIYVNPDAKAFLNISDDTACAPFDINNIIASPQVIPSRNATYSWYANNIFYGNSANSNPGYVLATAGDSATIKMVAISAFGCKNDSTEHEFFTIPNPVTSFMISDTVKCGPTTFTFTNTTPNADWFTYHWNFGNGQTFTGKTPPVVMFQPNPTYGDTVYQVKLTAFSECDTIDYVKSIRVKSTPKSTFTPDVTFGCSPMKVNFTNITKGLNVSYKWDFGDGTVQLTNDTNKVSHTYHTAIQDTFYAKLIASNECGIDTMVYAIVVAPNTIQLDFAVNGNEHSGCAPHVVKFINHSSGATAFRWDFGDGNIQNTIKNIDTIIHTYNQPGTYQVLVEATNGCTDTTSTENIQVFAKPLVNFSATPVTACIGDSIYFANLTDTATGYVWKFGDGSLSNITNPYKFYTQPGLYKVTLIASRQYNPGNSCVDSTSKQINIVASQPGAFTASDTVSSCVPFTVNFANLSKPSTLTTWNFGDNTTGTGDNVSHTFTKVGSYVVAMTAKHPGGCTYTATKTIVVNGPEGTWKYDKGYICGNTPVRFEVTATGADSIKWHYGNGITQTTQSKVVYHSFTQPGSFLPKAEMLSGNCKVLLPGLDTIKVDYVTAGFKFSEQKVCDKTTLSFTDTSRSFFPMSNYAWNFGNSVTSTAKNPVQGYLATGSYTITLVAKGVSGCSDTATQTPLIKINDKPQVSIVAAATGCVNRNYNFTSVVNAIDSVSNYYWQYSNGASSTSPVVNMSFGTTGSYTTRLIVGTVNGCYDTTTRSFTVNPTPVVKTNEDRLICKGQSYQLAVTGANTYQWSPTTGLSCSTCTNPVAKPLTTTEYIVTGRNNFGCEANDTVLITVAQPIDITVSGIDTICIGQTTQLHVTGATTYAWSPSTTLSSATSADPVVTTDITTRYRVIGFDSHNCFQDTAYITVAVGKYPTVKLPLDTILSTGTKYPIKSIITEGPIKTWNWTPSTDLSCDNCPQPVATIKNDICYTLEATNIYGCSAKDTACIKVFCANTQVFIPNAFTPDQPNNRLLMVRGTGIKTVNSFRIYNRWGQKVFERSHFQPNTAEGAWDGKINGIPATPDVFVYTCEVVCDNGTPYTFKGNVAIIK